MEPLLLFTYAKSSKFGTTKCSIDINEYFVITYQPFGAPKHQKDMKINSLFTSLQGRKGEVTLNQCTELLMSGILARWRKYVALLISAILYSLLPSSSAVNLITSQAPRITPSSSLLA